MFFPSPLLAFGWVSLPMLGWLGAAAAPILIHLWSRRKYREMSFSAMEYLLAAVRRQTRRLLFEQWLLLAVRTLLVVLVVLAVAEPYVERAGMAFTPGGHVHRVLVFDGSYSMAYKPADKTRFDHAKQFARRIVNDSPQGDAFTLVLMSSTPRVIVGTAALEPAAILQEIDNLELPHTMADLPAAIPAIRQLIASVAADNPRLDRREVYFLSDLQRTTWAPQLSEAARAHFLDQTNELAQLANLFVVDLGQPSAANLAITDLHTADSLITAGRDTSFQVRLQHFGPVVNDRQLVELFVDGRRIAQTQVELSPDGTGRAEFSYRFDAPGDHTVEARASGDALDVDNHRYLALTVRQAIRVLCIDGHPSGGSFRGAADYLAVALVPQSETSDRAPLQAEVAAESALLERNLASYDCLFLCNVAQFTGSEAGALNAYLQGGGCVVFFLGDQVLADRYNHELGVAGEGRAGEPHILPARLGRVIDRPQFRLDPLGYRHPILEAFRGRGQTSLLTTPVFKHFQLTPSQKSRATTVLALGNGDPLVIEQSVRRGRVVLVGTSAEPSWTAMPLWPSFVPLAQEIVAWCAAGQLQRRNVLAGETFDALTSAVGASVSVQSPDGRKRPAQLKPAGDRFALTYADTLQSGIYTVQFGPPANRSQTFAVNVDTAESDLAAIDPDELRDETWPDIPFVYQTSWQDIKGTGVGSARGQQGLHVDLLYAALGLALAEVLLAWKLGARG
ncbi:MAG: BatA domain-containing protein [Thermoguttaceae bacterium]